MCGIAGIHKAEPGQKPSESLVKRMTDAIAHRGPDGEGLHAEPGVALGHRRLAVIDPAGGQQPMYNEDGSVVIVFNGEIYNFATIRDELIALGHVFRNRCDTEAIVHAWESWGPDCVARLSGMFAFAIWDRNRRQLFCARDRLGKKPFYYGWAGGDFVFASEMAALAQVPGLPRRIRPQAVEDFFAFGYVPEPGTIFDGIRKLPRPVSTFCQPNQTMARPTIRTTARLKVSKKRRAGPVIFSVRAERNRWSLRLVATEAPMKTP